MHRIDQAVRSYSEQFDALMSMLQDDQGGTEMHQFLALRLDFNNYHAGQQKNNQPAVITGTPPQKSADLSTLDRGSAEMNKSAIDQMLASTGADFSGFSFDNEF